MTKEELLQELSGKVSAGELSREEVVSRLGFISGASVVNSPDSKIARHFTVTKMLYVLGAAIIILGVGFFAAQIWDDIGSFGRVLITLGFGLLLTAIGSVLLKQKPGESIGPVFLAIGGILIPGGAGVLLSEFNVDFVSLWPIVSTFGIITLFYLLLNLFHKHVVLTLFSVFNGTAFIYSLVGAMVGDSFYNHGDLYAYLTMVMGLAYLLLAYSFQGGWNQKLVGILYFLGSLGFLGAAFSRVFDSVPWQMLYFLLVIGGLFLSAYVKNRGVLAVSTIFLIAHVSYFTSEYFADSLGWPISLIILGFIFIGLGYMSIRINKKYIKQ